MLSTLLGHSKPTTNPSPEPSDPSRSPRAEEADEDIVNSTPRSEINNPMSDAAILAATAKHSPADKETSSNSRPSTSDGSAKKLSAAAGANSSLLRRADPKDLPSYPSRGIVNLEASAGKAALLAASQSKSPELWKPSSLPAAGAAASLAANSTHKTPEPWNPGPLPPSAAAAALLADSSHKSPEVWTPGHRPSKSASKAASLAREYSINPPSNTTTTGGGTSLADASAATSLAAAGLANQQTTSQTRPGTAPAGATSSQSGNMSTTPAYDINKINTLAAQNAQNRLTSAHPPPSQSQTDKNMSDILRAATISMAKKQKQEREQQQQQQQRGGAPLQKSQSQIGKNYNTTLSSSAPAGNYTTSPPGTASSTKMPPASFFSHLPTTLPGSTTTTALEPSSRNKGRPSSLAAASLATKNDLASPRHRKHHHGRHHSEKVDTQSSFEKQTKYYPHLEEAARKAAADRLALLQAEHDQARKASGLPPTWAPSNPVSDTSSAPTRTSNSGMHFSKATSRKDTGITGGKTTLRKNLDPTDFARALKIKSDTAKLGNQMAAVDRDKQSQQYLTLLSLAEKNVKSRMQDLETKVAEDQGRVPKHLQEEWDAKAKILSEEAERKRVVEDEKKKGKIDMGGGLWYDQEDLERIARGNVQPILEEINEKAVKERARVQKIKEEREEEERKKREEAERKEGVKKEERRVKAEEKAAQKERRENERAEERQRRAEYKESQRQAKEAAKAEKQEKKEQQKALSEGATAVAAAKKEGEDEEPLKPDHGLEELEPRPMSGGAEYDRVDREREMREEQKRRSGFFGSIQKKLRRDHKSKDKDKEKEKTGEKGFVKIRGVKGVGSREELKGKISEPIPYVGPPTEELGMGMGTAPAGKDDDDEISSLSSMSSLSDGEGGVHLGTAMYGHHQRSTSAREVAMAGTATLTSGSRRSVSPVSIEGGDATAEPGTTANPIFGSTTVGPRYIPRSLSDSSSSSDSSTDSDDLYSDRFKSLTSATYHPGGGEDMPAFVPDVDSDDEVNKQGTEGGVYKATRNNGGTASGISSSSVSLSSTSSEGEAGEKKNKGAEEGEESPKTEQKRHHTFGAMVKERLAGLASAPFVAAAAMAPVPVLGTGVATSATIVPPATTSPDKSKVDEAALEQHLQRAEERKLEEVTPSTAVPAPIAPISSPQGGGLAPITAAAGRDSIDSSDNFQEARDAFQRSSSPLSGSSPSGKGAVKKSRFSEVW